MFNEMLAKIRKSGRPIKVNEPTAPVAKKATAPTKKAVKRNVKADSGDDKQS